MSDQGTTGESEEDPEIEDLIKSLTELDVQLKKAKTANEALEKSRLAKRRADELAKARDAAHQKEKQVMFDTAKEFTSLFGKTMYVSRNTRGNRNSDFVVSRTPNMIAGEIAVTWREQLITARPRDHSNYEFKFSAPYVLRPSDKANGVNQAPKGSFFNKSNTTRSRKSVSQQTVAPAKSRRNNTILARKKGEPVVKPKEEATKKETEEKLDQPTPLGNNDISTTKESGENEPAPLVSSLGGHSQVRNYLDKIKSNGGCLAAHVPHCLVFRKDRLGRIKRNALITAWSCSDQPLCFRPQKG